MELLYILSFFVFLQHRGIQGDVTVSLKGPESPDSPPVISCGGVDLVFLVDTSRSIWELDFKRQLNFIDKVVSKFDIGPGPKQTRVGVILYAHTYWVWFYLRQYMDPVALRNAIKRIPHKAGARTRTEKGLHFLRTQMYKEWFGGRPNTTHVAILISDGQSQDTKKTREEAKKVREAGIKVFTIGVGKRANMEELREIASDPDEHFVFQVGNFKALDSINYKLPTSTCQDLEYTTKFITKERETSTSTLPTTTTMTTATTTTMTTTSGDTSIPPILLLEPATYLVLEEASRSNNKNKVISPLPSGSSESEAKTLSSTVVSTTKAPTTLVVDDIESTPNVRNIYQEALENNTLLQTTDRTPRVNYDDISSRGNVNNNVITTKSSKDLEVIDASSDGSDKSNSDTVLSKELTEKQTMINYSESNSTKSRQNVSTLPNNNARTNYELSTNPSITREPILREDTNDEISVHSGYLQSTASPNENVQHLELQINGISLANGNTRGQTTTLPPEILHALGRSDPIQREFFQTIETSVNNRDQTTTVSTEILQELAAYSLKPITEDQAEIMSNYILRDVPAQTYCDGKDADIYFVLDGSNSIWPEDFKVQLQFVNNVIDVLDVTHGNTRVGVIVYSTQIHPIIMIDSGMTRSQIKRQVNAIKYVSGRTNTSDALRFVRQYGFSKERTRENAVKLAIILTDGISRRPLLTKKESNLCRDQGIHLFAVGIGNKVDKTELKRIANDPDHKFMFHVDSYQALNRIRDFLAITACSVAPDQPRTDPVCKDLGALDVLFSYDSFALGSRKSQMINFFIHDLLNSIDFSNGNLRVGRMTDNCPEITDIPIGSNVNISDFTSTDYPGIPSLLKRMKTGFSNRQDVKKLGVLFVDESTEKINNAIRVLKDGIDYNLMVVGIGDERITEAAGDLCSYPKHDYFIQVPKYSNLLRARSKLLDKICTTMMGI